MNEITIANHGFAEGEEITMGTARLRLWRIASVDRDQFQVMRLSLLASLIAHVRIFFAPEMRRVRGWFR